MNCLNEWKEEDWWSNERVHEAQTITITDGSIETQSVAFDGEARLICETSKNAPSPHHRYLTYAAPVGTRAVVKTHTSTGATYFKQYIIAG